MTPPPATLRVDVRARVGDFRLEVAFSTRARATALFGPSGAGKSTLLRLIAGLTRGEGSIQLAGEELLDPWVPPERRGVGVVFQDARLLPHLGVADNLRYGLRRTPRARQRLTYEAVVALLDLGALLPRRVRGLSGGEAKRVALGRALLTSPRLLLLDEPLAGLDAGRRGHLLAALQRLGAALEVPMLLVSHAADEVLALTDDVVVIDGGRVLGQGPFFEVIGAAGVFPLADALGLVNLLPGTVTSTGEGLVEVAVGDGVARAVGRAVAGEAVTLRLRPEDVLVATRPPRGLSARNQLRGRIARIVAVHDRYLATIDLGGEALLRAELTAGAIAELELAPGVAVWAVFKATAVRVG